jgi:hypothetical protein
MRRIVRVAAAVALLAAPADAHLALVGGFRPAAAEEGARAVWVNPAAVGQTGLATAVVELFLTEPTPPPGVEWGVPSEPTALSAAAATDRLAYGWQHELDDRAGVPDWTFTVANRVRVGREASLGAALEWLGGDDGGLEGAAAVLFPSGRHVRFAAVLHELFDRGADAAGGTRRWQLGGALRIPPLLARVTYDAVLPWEGGEAVHWVAFALDRSKAAHLSVARSSEGDWSASLDLAFPNHLLGIGALDRDVSQAKPDEGFVSAEWYGRALAERSRRR